MPDSRQIHPFLDGNGRIGGLLITFRMREEYRVRITEHLGRAAANGQRVMDRLFDHPIVTVATVREWLGITPAGANQIVNRRRASACCAKSPATRETGAFDSSPI